VPGRQTVGRNVTSTSTSGGGREIPTLLGLLERANLTYQVQKKGPTIEVNSF
jgi:hypothetical protein